MLLGCVLGLEHFLDEFVFLGAGEEGEDYQ